MKGKGQIQWKSVFKWNNIKKPLGEVQGPSITKKMLSMLFLGLGEVWEKISLKFGLFQLIITHAHKPPDFLI
jgi:hypothetical protein